MKKLTLTLMRLAAIDVGLSFTPTLAQNGPPDPAQMVQMRIDRMDEALKLSTSQKTQATAIYMNAQTANQSVMANMRSANEALTAAIKSNDANAITQAANTIGTIMAQMTVNNAKGEAAVYATLTPDQQAKFQPMGGGRGIGMGMGGGGGRGRGGPPPQE